MKRQFILLSALATLLAGCQSVREHSLTCKVWEGAPGATCDPAPEPRLELFQKAGPNPEILVVYDEVVGRTCDVRRRAFFLQRNELRLDAGRRPRFTDPRQSTGLESIPVQAFQPAGSNQLATVSYPAISAGTGQTPGPASAGLWAKVFADSGTFVLHSGNRELRQYALPVYVDRVDRTERALVTPLAVAGDAALLGLVVGVYAGIAVCYSYAGFSR